MITLYSGIPGSGKTYKMVAELSRQKDKYYVVHNIDGLKDEVLGEYGSRFIDYCQVNNMPVTDFFDKDFQIEYTKAIYEKYQRPVLVIIDEAQEWFSKNDKNLKMWLSYHRHLNQDIWMVAHRVTNLSTIYRSFIEVEFRAKSGQFVNVPGFFIYNRILGGQRSGYVKERKDKKIFELYKSMLITGESKGKKSYFMIGLCCIVLMGAAIFFVVPRYVIGGEAKDKEETKKSHIENSKEAQKKEFDLKHTMTVENRFRYVGTMGENVVLEDRQTGVQLPLKRISGKYIVIEVRGLDSVILYSKDTRSYHEFFNVNGYVQKSDPVGVGGHFTAAPTGSASESIRQVADSFPASVTN